MASMIHPSELAVLLARQPSWITAFLDFLKRIPPVADMAAGASTAFPGSGFVFGVARVIAAFGKIVQGSAVLKVQDVLEAFQGVLTEGQRAGKKPAVLIFDEANVLRQVRGGGEVRVRQGRAGGDAMRWQQQSVGAEACLSKH